MTSKTYRHRVIGGNCDGSLLESTTKPKQREEFRAGHDLYEFRRGAWRFQKVLLGKFNETQSR